MTTTSRLAHLRGAWRMMRVAIHLVFAMMLVTCVYPLLVRKVRLRLRLTRRWSSRLLSILGVRLQATGGTLREGELVVANHVSWLDIHVINAVAPCVFVAKDDVGAWPLIGWLGRRTGTIFLARSSVRSARVASAAVAAALADGITVAVFPEGTTTAGRTVLPFHGALLQGALDATAAVRPLALRYIDVAGRFTDVPAYFGETRLIDSLWRVACAPDLAVEVTVLPPLLGGEGDRRLVATVARGMIAIAVEHGWHGSRQSQRAATPETPQVPKCSITSLPG